jgi:hypothetical protein
MLFRVKGVRKIRILSRPELLPPPVGATVSKAGTIAEGRLTDRSVANIVKAYAERAGFDATTFSGHSLRSGFLTSAAAKGASIFKMTDVSRHKSVDTLRG